MKIRTLLLVLLFAETLLVSAGEYLLPIGENVNSRSAKVQMVIGGYGAWSEDTFSYEPTMGPLVDIIKSRLQNLATGFTPALGYENESNSLEVLVTPGPFGGSLFVPQQSNDLWVIPEEVLNVDLQYGSVSVLLRGVAKVEMEVRGEGRTERFSSEGGGTGSPCTIQTVDWLLKIGNVTLEREYVNPKYRASWVTEGEVTLWENDDRKAVFNILTGYLVEASDPPPSFLESLRFPPLPAPPRITAIKREGSTTTITVAGETNAVLTVEWKPAMRDYWQVVSSGSSFKLNDNATGTFTHITEAPMGFYRLSVFNSGTPAVKKP